MAAQIARACAVFRVDEIVVFNDGQSHNNAKRPAGRNYQHEDEQSGYTGYTDPDDFLYHVLSYLETPPHLRKMLFPLHPNLRTAGSMPSLDMPHHLRATEWCQYREGVTVGGADAQQQQGKKRRKSDGFEEAATLVECGLPVPARIPVSIPPNTRVTVKFESEEEPQLGNAPYIAAEAVSPDAPREEAGYYWGYSTRVASSLSAVFTESPYDGGYDLSFGTSERGVALSSLVQSGRVPTEVKGDTEDAPPIPNAWNHMVIVYGGVAGLEVALAADHELTSKGVTEARDVFDYWINLVPGQGSRTIRTEEAVWLGLMGLQDAVQSRQ